MKLTEFTQHQTELLSPPACSGLHLSAFSGTACERGEAFMLYMQL